MNFHALSMMADQKIAEDREWAARCRLAVEADRVRREARQPAGSPLAGLFRTLASALGFGRPVLPVIIQEPGLNSLRPRPFRSGSMTERLSPPVHINALRSRGSPRPCLIGRFKSTRVVTATPVNSRPGRSWW